MLQDIRDKLLGKFALVLIGVIAVSFVFWGASTPFISTGFAAKVDGVEISRTDLEQAYRSQLAQYSEQFGELPESFKRPLRERVLGSLVRNTVVDVHVAEEGFRISDEFVTLAIQRTPDFQVDGVFSKDRYYDLLAGAGLGPAQYEARQKRAMRQNQLQRSIAATAFVTPAEYRRYLNLVGEQRRMSLATFDPASIADDIEVTEDEIGAFYDDRPGEFTTPESADVEYIEIRRDELAERVELSEEALQAYYEDSKNRYLQDEQRRARHILLPFGDDEDAALEQARALTARARAGEPFEDLARQYSKDGGTSAQGGDLGLVMQSQMPGELGDAIFSMFEGDVEGPVKTDFGYHVVRLDEIVQPGPMPLAEVRHELETELRDSEVDSIYREVERKLSDALFDATELGPMAESVGLEVKSIERFARAGGDPFGANQAAIDAIFDDRVLNDGEISEIVELDANRSAVFQVSNHYEAARQSIDEVRELIVGALRTEKARNIVSGKVNDLLAAVAGGADFSEAATPTQAQVTGPMLVTRDSESPAPEILVEVFNADKPSAGDPTMGTAITRSGVYAVYSVSEVIPGRPESIPLAERDAAKAALTQQSGIEDYNALVSQLEQEADIVINDDALAEQDFF